METRKVRSEKCFTFTSDRRKVAFFRLLENQKLNLYHHKKHDFITGYAAAGISPYGQSVKEMLEEIKGKWELDDHGNVTFVKIIEAPDLER